MIEDLSAVCVSCGSGGGRDRGAPLHLVACDRCWSSAQTEPDVDEFSRLTVPGGSPTQVAAAWRRTFTDDSAGRCNDCGAAVEWYTTAKGRRVALEPGKWPTLPAGSSWRVDSADIAHKIVGYGPGGAVRMCHFDTCPVRVAQPPAAQELRTVWERHRGHYR